MNDTVVNVLKVLVVIGAITVHESAHAWSADRLGDPTARHAGRMTLNPIPHIDPVGTILVPVLLTVTTGTAFGWAKPVPINPHNFRHRRIGMMLSALAGPGSNLLAAVAFGVAWQIGMVAADAGGPALVEAAALPTSPLGLMIGFFEIAAFVNVFLAVFNLIPIPPLDGSRVVPVFLPEGLAHRWDELERYGFLFFFLLVFVVPSAIGFDPIGLVFTYVARPLTGFLLTWGLGLAGIA
jgi:Zn-dependent protease